MSLILDALNRSESDRLNPDAVPGLQSRHGQEPALPAWRRFLWPALALLFALLALGLWLGSGGEEPAATPTLVAAPQAPVAAEPVSAQRPSAPVQAAPAGREPAQAAPAVVAPAEPVPARAATEPALDPDVAALYQQAPEPSAPLADSPADARVETAAAAAAEPAAPALDVDAMTQAAQAALEQRAAVEAPVVEHAAPYITDLRQSIKDQIPSIFYNEHSWASDPAERSVVLNRKRYTEGQQIKPGLRLLEILPDSIVLEFNGSEFRLQSLNSWVNL